jgi:4-hydroxy-2-oxoheptanedioate aldolase
MHEGKQLRAKLKAGQTCLGAWVTFSDPGVTELMGGSGYDFLLFDAEHAPLTLSVLEAQFMACKGSAATPIVRLAWNDMVVIKQVLDLGAAGVLVPMVNSAAEAERAVRACLYPPEGVRGFAPRRPGDYGRTNAAYAATANADVVVWVQIEHIAAVEAIDEIVRVPRLDGVLIGPADLSASLGLLGQPNHPRVLAAIGRTIAAAQAVGMPVGLAGPRQPELARAWIKQGIQFITLGDDMSYLVQASEAAVSGVRALLQT